MKTPMKNIVKDMYKFAPQILGAGYDNCIEYLKQLIGLDVIEIPSGTKFDMWTVPDEWIVHEAWVKHKGKKIIDYAKDPLSLAVYSRPFKGTMDREELKQHLYSSNERLDATPYEFTFYEDKWGVCMPKNKVFDKNKKDKLPKGKYEVFINTELKPGIMKLGVHTIKGKSDREILLFAHIDHPHQANDNLSGVACLTHLTHRIKKKYNHTVKIIFCPETIGSIGYAFTQDISKVDFVIAVDICGSDSKLTLQWDWNRAHRLNKIARLAMLHAGEDFDMGPFRAGIGSDEYVFNDPVIGIPALLLTRYPYPEYHTSDDTPDIIKEDKMKHVQEVIMSIIDMYEKDFIPARNFKGPFMRSKYGAQTPVAKINTQLDYLFYNIDGTKYLSEIVHDVGLTWPYCYKLMEQLVKDGLITKVYGEIKFYEANNRPNVGPRKKPTPKK